MNVSWSWTLDGAEQSAFDELKQLITSTPILVLPDQTKHFRLETDASAYATGAVLSQLCDDGKWRPVGFVSKSLSETECNYAIHDKELLSVICELEEWGHILEGTKHKVEILNDHQNWPTFTPLKTSIVAKLASPSTFLALISNWSTILDVTQPSLMPSQDQ